MNPIASSIKEQRKRNGLTQEKSALRSGLGLRFVRELEQDKNTVRLGKANQALAMFSSPAHYRKRKENASGVWLTLSGYPAGYSIKLQTEEYPHLPELEDVVMHMADAAAIETVPHALVRYQLSLQLTEGKYKGSYEQCRKLIHHSSSRKMLDATNFLYLQVFCFITGNSDMHLKN